MEDFIMKEEIMKEKHVDNSEKMAFATPGGGMTWHGIGKILNQHLVEQNVTCVDPKNEL